MGKKIDYRKIYKNHYNIEFGKEYVVHHIDENRDNNEISNLLLLPLELHSKYHTCKNYFGNVAKNGICFDLTDSGRMLRDMQLSELEKLLEVIKSIQEWVQYKFLADNCNEIYPMFDRKQVTQWQ